MARKGFRRLLDSLRPDRLREVDDELRSHIEMKAEDLESEGVSRADARAQARRSFGDVGTIRRQCRRLQAQIRGRRARGEVLDGLLQDLGFAARTLARNPGFGVVAIATLALGIGASTAVFSVVNGLLLRSLPGIAAPERLVEVTQGDGDDFASISYPVFEHLRDGSSTLDDLAAFDVVSLAMGGDDGTPEVYFGLQVSSNYFSVLGVEPALGRFFDVARSFREAEDAVVLSHGLWQRRFSHDPDVLGRSVLLNGYPARIIGVASPGFGGHVVAAKADVFVPLGMPAPEMHRAESLSRADNNMLEAVGRLAPESSRPAAAAELQALADRFAEVVLARDTGYPVQTGAYAAVPGSVRTGAAAFLSILMVVVGMLLVITCVNVAHMMLARAGSRQREIAVRLSMGASRGRLIRQLLTESLMIAALAAVGGALLSLWLTSLLGALEPPVLPFPGMRLELDFGFDARVLAFSVAVTCLTTLLFGLVPALRASRPDPVTALKDAGAAGRPGRSRLRGLLVAGQMALTIVLLLGSGLFLRAFRSAQTVDTGFDARDAYVGGFDLGLNGYDRARAELFYDELTAAAKGLPGVESAALAGKLPLAGASTTTVQIPGVNDQSGRGFNLHNQSASADYFQVLGLSLLRGRTFEPADSADAPMVAVINATMAERFWSIDEALGQTIILFGEVPVQIVGVVADAKYHALDEQTPIFAYFSHRQRPRGDMYLHLKASPGIDRTRLWDGVRRIAGDLDPAVPLLSAGALPDALRIFVFPQLVAAWITGVVGLVGLVLGVVGIYGVTAHAASRRTHEIGVRIALGAGGRELRRMMVRQGMIAPLVGMVVGLALAGAITRLMGTFLFGVSPLDPLTFGTVSVLLGSAALCATLLPARRAARVDPVVTLKAE